MTFRCGGGDAFNPTIEVNGQSTPDGSSEQSRSRQAHRCLLLFLQIMQKISGRKNTGSTPRPSAVHAENPKPVIGTGQHDKHT
jgi:hypothetical protein